MSLSDLASIAIIVQGFLFVVSIGLVWYQLRENTKLVRAANAKSRGAIFALLSPTSPRSRVDRTLAASNGAL